MNVEWAKIFDKIKFPLKTQGEFSLTLKTTNMKIS